MALAHTIITVGWIANAIIWSAVALLSLRIPLTRHGWRVLRSSLSLLRDLWPCIRQTAEAQVKMSADEVGMAVIHLRFTNAGGVTVAPRGMDKDYAKMEGFK